MPKSELVGGVRACIEVQAGIFVRKAVLLSELDPSSLKSEPE